MTVLSEEQKRRVTHALDAAGSTLPCPRCGHQSFSLVDGYVIEFVQSQLRNMVVGGSNRLPSVVVTCDRCGFLAQHALESLNI